MTSQNWVSIDSDKSMLPHSTRPLTQPLLTFQRWSFLRHLPEGNFTGDQATNGQNVFQNYTIEFFLEWNQISLKFFWGVTDKMSVLFQVMAFHLLDTMMLTNCCCHMASTGHNKFKFIELTHILQGCFTDTEAIAPLCQWSNQKQSTKKIKIRCIEDMSLSHTSTYPHRAWH